MNLPFKEYRFTEDNKEYRADCYYNCGWVNILVKVNSKHTKYWNHRSYWKKVRAIKIS